MTSTPPRAFGASAHAACSSPCGPAQVIGAVGSASVGSGRWGARRLADVTPRGGGRRFRRRSLVLAARGDQRRRRRCCADAEQRQPVAALRAWTTVRRRGRWRFPRRCNAVVESPSRVCARLPKSGSRFVFARYSGGGMDARRRGPSGRVAVVAGATRGAGRGIAAALGEAGATVVCTGRSSLSGSEKSDYDRSGDHRGDRRACRRTRR